MFLGEKKKKKLHLLMLSFHPLPLTNYTVPLFKLCKERSHCLSRHLSALSKCSCYLKCALQIENAASFQKWYRARRFFPVSDSCDPPLDISAKVRRFYFDFFFFFFSLEKTKDRKFSELMGYETHFSMLELA